VGGVHGQGVVFKLTPQTNGNWTEAILHNFPSSSGDGGGPNGGLIQDRAGNWYGTTVGGGYHNTGTIFELTHRSHGWAEFPLYKFGTSNADDGYGPTAGLVMGKAGNLYGAAPRGGPTLGGAAFELTPRSGGWQETLIDTFSQKNDGGGPFAGLILDTAGNLYGTTEGGGAYDLGTAYAVEHTSTGWHEKVLHSFDNNGVDGVGPGWGVLFMDNSGSLYGTTSGGGSHTCFASEIKAIANGPGAGHFPGNAIGNCGTIFKLIKLADGRWKETILYNFNSGATGSGPGAGVVMDKTGNLYGTTIYGGSGCGCGVVYKLAPNTKGTWTYAVLHTFVGSDGAQPDANLIVDDKGNLYGTTATGGAYGGGVVFELTP
jgi:uncharacterized repeat protein (TIGR03803 family)